MAPTPGISTAYDLTIGVKVNMDEAIYLLSPLDTPLLTGLGADGLSVLGSEPVDEILFDWMTETILTPRSTLNGAVTTGDAFITLASGDQTKFSTGDMLKIVKAGVSAAEMLRVTGYGTTADTLLVTRGYDSTTATNYSSLAVVIGLGTSLAEGSDPQNARSVDRVDNNNYTQIFGPTAVNLSRTEQQVAKYGISNEWTHQMMARTQENAIAREQAYLYGHKSNSSTSKIRTTGGMAHYITSNVDSSSTQLTVLKIQTLLQTNYDNGGLPDRLIANPAAFLDLNDVGNTSIIRQEIDDPLRGRVRTEQIYTEFGSITLVRDRWCARTDAFGIRRDNVKRRILQSLVFEKLAKTGDSDKGQVVCEEGLEVKGQEHQFRFVNLGY